MNSVGKLTAFNTALNQAWDTLGKVAAKSNRTVMGMLAAQVVAREALLLPCSSDGDGGYGRGVDAHRGGCAREGLLPCAEVPPCGGRGSIDIRRPCMLPRVRALCAALPWRSGVVHGAGASFVVVALLLCAVAVLFVVGALVFLVS